MEPNRVGLIRLVRAIKSRADLQALLPYAKPISWYRPGQSINVADKMQTRYTYVLSEPIGKNFAPEFKPHLSPPQMLRRGVFEGKYLNDCILEYPREWYAQALINLRPGLPDPQANEFRIKSRKSLNYWRRKRWIPIVESDKDVRGWFQWYCRYYLGRRDSVVDTIQIARWRSFIRHARQIQASYRRLARPPNTLAEKRAHRPRQRQALLQWAYDPYV